MEENSNLNQNNENRNINNDQQIPQQENRGPIRSQNNIPFSIMNDIQNFPSSEKFLFLFDVEKLAYQCCCGCSLKTGIRIISFFFLFSAASEFINIFSQFSFSHLISTVFICSIYSTIGYCFTYSTIYYSAKHAFYGYFLYSLLFFMACLDSFFFILILISGYYEPFGIDKKMVKLIIFLIAIGIFLGIHLYILYICYSFWKHLKNGDIDIINGNISNNQNDNVRENNTNENV